ncbi:MAG: 4Fe-4S binding protein [Candidatus Omnitrophota bacterium]
MLEPERGGILMAARDIIEIDRDKCDGCGLCTTACVEGALVLDAQNKAVLVKEIYCDGLGACLNVCPTGALKIVKKDTAEYDPQEAYQHVLRTQGPESAAKVHGAPVSKLPAAPSGMCGCPGSAARSFSRKESPCAGGPAPAKAVSELGQWPIQLHLVSPRAPYLKGCDLLVAADCTAFALGSFHSDLLKGKKLLIACPKLDDTQGYAEKLTELIECNDLRSLTVAIMEVPCCRGLLQIVQEAARRAKGDFGVQTVVVGIEGQLTGCK